MLDLDGSEALGRAVEISLFTWRRAAPDDPVDDSERHGWWGDSFPSEAGDRIGSRLWLLRRRRLDADCARDAEFYTREALQWLLDDGHVQRLDVQLTRAPNRLSCALQLYTPLGRFDFTFDDLWQVIHAV